MNSIQGKHAFVTGASRGIGAAIAATLEDAGAVVTRSARQARDGVLACDVCDAAAVATAMTQAEQRHGAIDILINNAGVGRSAKFLNTDAAMLDEMLDINLKGAWHCSQRALPAMIKAGWGRIVNIASLAGLNGYTYTSAYCVSKHAVVGLARSLAAEYGGKGIAVAAICPGYTDSDMLAETVANMAGQIGISTEEARARVAALNPDGRIIAPSEVADAVLALCLAENILANGQIISIPETTT